MSERIDDRDMCRCGHARSRHLMGQYYCIEGTYTTQEQRDYLVARGAPDLPVCVRFTPSL
jgi:hypothetical protein